MEDKVVVRIKDEEETWVTTIIMTEVDALRIRNLRPSTRLGHRIEIPSVEGFAQTDGETLKLIYRGKASQKMISAQFDYARDMLDQAIAQAADERRSSAAWERIWEWASERNEDTRTLTLTAGEQISATFLMSEDEHVAVLLRDGSLAIITVTNEDAMPPVGSDVTLTLDDTGSTILLLG